MTYKHTQTGRVILVSMGICALIGVGICLATRNPPIAWVVVVILALSAVLFGTLTVQVDETKLKWSFGPGLVRKSVDIANIAQAEPVRNSWMYGWGIHLTRHGWLYNVSGWDAVQIRMKNGKQFRLGTDEPEALVAAINDAKKTSITS